MVQKSVLLKKDWVQNNEETKQYLHPTTTMEERKFAPQPFIHHVNGYYVLRQRIRTLQELWYKTLETNTIMVRSEQILEEELVRKQDKGDKKSYQTFSLDEKQAVPNYFVNSYKGYFYLRKKIKTSKGWRNKTLLNSSSVYLSLSY